MVAGLSISLVEDNVDLRLMLTNILRDEGHLVSAYESAEQMLESQGMVDVEVFIIDINLPGEDGLSLARRLHAVSPDVHIIMVTARHDLQARVRGYDSGADLYLVKPIQVPELVAALRRVARRKHHRPQETTLTLNKSMLIGELGEERLTRDEVVLLTGLARAPSGKLETWQFAALLETEMSEGFRSSLVLRISRLRKKLLKVSGSGELIEPLRHIGYRLLVKVTLI